MFAKLPLLAAIGRATTKISGSISLIDKDLFMPGTSDLVKITFIRGMIDDNKFKVGETFTFDEGLQPILGTGEIIESNV